MRKHIIGENGLVYTLGKDGYYYPNIVLKEEVDYPIGKYGRMRKAYLMEHRKALYTNLLMNGTLNKHLYENDEKCNKWVDEMIEYMKVREGGTEQMKAENQMLWVGMMNNIKACAEEVVFAELIYK